MAKTLVGVFDDKASAQTVLRELQAMGIPNNQARMMNNSEGSPEASQGTDIPWTEKVGNWFSSLFEDDSDRALASNYTEAWQRGSYIVVADVESAQVDEVVALMNRYGTVDLTRRAQGSEKSGATQSTPLYAQTDREQPRQGQAIPIVQEELTVGKRVVQRGGVRIHSYVQERPVEEQVRLREEQVNVQRRPVDRAATSADLAFQEKTIDVPATGEEVVIEKRARVVEEVIVGKSVQEREETVKDTVRRKEVQVEQLPKKPAPPAQPRHR